MSACVGRCVGRCVCVHVNAHVCKCAYVCECVVCVMWDYENTLYPHFIWFCLAPYIIDCTHTYTHTHIYTYIHTLTCVGTCKCVCVCMCVCVCACVCVCMCVCVCVCVYHSLSMEHGTEDFLCPPFVTWMRKATLELSPYASSSFLMEASMPLYRVRSSLARALLSMSQQLRQWPVTLCVCVCVCVCVEGGGDEGGGKSTSGGGIRGKGQRERAYFELVDSSKSVEGRYWQQPLQ